VIVMSRGPISVGDIVGVHNDEAQPGYDVQFGEFRTVTYDTPRGDPLHRRSV